MNKRKNIIKIAIDSPAAAGAGTLAKALSKHYNLKSKYNCLESQYKLKIIIQFLNLDFSGK